MKIRYAGRKTGWTLALLALSLLAGGGLAAGAQQPPPGEGKQGPIEPKAKEEQVPYAVRVEVPIVNMDVTVVDKDGNFIHNLQREHFRVYSDGQEQEIVAFAPTQAPLTTVLLVEASRALGYLIYQNLESAYLFLNQLREEDWVALVSYDMKPRVEVDFTRDRQAILQSLRHMQFGSSGFSEMNMYDAVIDTVERLKDVEGKKSIILIATGFDTFSKHTWDDMRRVAREHDTTIFTLGMTWLLELYYDRLEARGARTSLARMDLRIAEAQLRDLAKQTGGRAYFPRFVTQVPNIYREIGAMLRNQYSLAFRPKDFERDGKFHKIEVKLLSPDGEKLKVINQHGEEVDYEIYARKGYYAPEG